MSAHKFAYLLFQKSFKLHLTLINHCFIFKGKIKSVIDVVLRLFLLLFFPFLLQRDKSLVKVMSRRGFRTSLNAMRYLPQICPRNGGAGNTRSFPSFLF